ncbi:MAG: hypothetical protein E7214_00400 [Clostridium sp.]|nr:hypothetical protein [Clostridium sp.]
MESTFIKDKLEVLDSLCEKEEFDKALEECNNILIKNRKDKDITGLITFKKALIYEAKSEYSKSLHYLDKAFDLGGYVDALIKKYNIYLYLNDNNEALKVIDKIIEINENLYIGYDLKFNLLFNLGLYDEAFKVIKITEEKFEASSIITLNKVKSLVRLKRFNETEKIIKQEKDNIDIQYDLKIEEGMIEAFKGNVREAIDLFKEVYKIFPNNIKLIYLIGSFSLLGGEVDESHEYFKKLLDIEYSQEQIYLIGLYYYGVTLKLKNSDKVQEYFNALIRKYSMYSMNYPNNLTITILKALVMYELNRCEEARKIIRRIEAITSKTVQTTFVQALLYKKENNIVEYEKAKDYIAEKDEVLSSMLKVIEGGNI